jgi:hypothetical protein
MSEGFIKFPESTYRILFSVADVSNGPTLNVFSNCFNTKVAGEGKLKEVLQSLQLVCRLKRP